MKTRRSSKTPQPLSIRTLEELQIHRELECLRAEGARYRDRGRIRVRRRKYLAVTRSINRQTTYPLV
jgi:hypothetical protein